MKLSYVLIMCLTSLERRCTTTVDMSPQMSHQNLVSTFFLLQERQIKLRNIGTHTGIILDIGQA